MNATQVQTGYQPVHQEEVSARTMTRGALMESIGAIATVVLAIAGLAGALPITLAAIATIVFGAAIWLEGGTFIASHSRDFSLGPAGAQVLERNEGLGIEFLGGMCGIVLGVLALLGITPITLLSIGLLVFGSTLLLSSETGMVSRNRALFGLAGLTLGLLAVCGLQPLTLVLVGLLCVGVSALFNGAAAGFRMAIASRE